MDYDIREAFEAIENELIESMMRNFSRHRAEEDAEGYRWSQWQALQLQSLEKYRKTNATKFNKQFSTINAKVTEMLKIAREDGNADQEVSILEAIQNGFKVPDVVPDSMTGEFFKVNDRKLDALIKATTDDLQQAETAILRRANDQYRSAIFNAQVYANTGAGTYAKAVDMACRDMLRSGLSCVEYSNGAIHQLSDYADMAIKTANKRAYLYGEGEKRKEWGLSLVVVNSRQGGCSHCLKYIGKVYIDDVYSGGKKSDGNYPLLSDAIKGGLFHPRCKDSTSTYYEGITTLEPVSKEEMAEMDRREKLEEQHSYYENQAKKNQRIADYSLDDDNKRAYQSRAEASRQKADEIGEKLSKSLEKSDGSGIIVFDKEETVVNDVRTIGIIDIEKYKCVASDIITDEVVITGKQIEHIKSRHPNDYERFSRFFKEIVENPDYIIEANKPNTALVLKEIKVEQQKFKMVLRMNTSADNPKHKNSIITFMKIDDKEWNRLLRNKKILYKSE